MNVWHNGLGATGSLYGTLQPLCCSGDVWFLDNGSANCADGSSPAGKHEVAPLETLQQAVDNAVDGDIVVVASTHDETLSAEVEIDKELIILGAGSADGVPSATFRCAVAQGNSIVLGSDFDGGCISNVRFVSAANSSSSVRATGARFLLDACYWDIAAGAVVALDMAGVIGATLDRCTFLNSSEYQTNRAISAVGCSNLKLPDLVLDAGTAGWSGGYAAVFGGGGQTGIWMPRLVLLRGSDVIVSGVGNRFMYSLSDSSSGQGRVSA